MGWIERVKVIKPYEEKLQIQVIIFCRLDSDHEDQERKRQDLAVLTGKIGTSKQVAQSAANAHNCNCMRDFSKT